MRLAVVMLVLIGASLGWAGGAAAQTIVQNTGSFRLNSPGSVGQSFTATLTGAVTQIQARPRTTQASTLRIYLGTGSGAVGAVGSPLLSQAVSLVEQESDLAGFQTFVLDTPVPVTAGQQYTFVFDNAGGAPSFAGTFDLYGGGTVVGNYNTPGALLDLAFTVTEVATPAAVPTLSEWALILLALAFAIVAGTMVNRRRAPV